MLLPIEKTLDPVLCLQCVLKITAMLSSFTLVTKKMEENLVLAMSVYLKLQQT